jgi:hypothetical protein
MESVKVALRWRVLIVVVTLVVVCVGVALAGPLAGGRLDPRTWFEPSLAELNAQAKPAVEYGRAKPAVADIRAAGCQCSVQGSRGSTGGVRFSTLTLDTGNGPQTVSFDTVMKAEVPPSISMDELMTKLFTITRRTMVAAEERAGGPPEGGTLWLVGPTWIAYGDSDAMKRLQEILGGELRPR